MEGTFECSDLDNITVWARNCSVLSTYANCTEELGDVCSSGGLCGAEPNIFKGVTIVLVFVISLIGNICTILLLSQFKVHKIPDVLVIGLALTDLLATVLPIAAAMYAYFSGNDFISGCTLCNLFGTVAQFTRYSSGLIVTLVSLERYYAVNRPFIYRKYATPKRFVKILIFCWLLALVLAVIPVLGYNTAILSNDGVCLFDLISRYAIGILMYSAIQYVIVFVCFVLVTVELCKVYRRRKKLKVQGNYNNNSMARHRPREVTFTRPNLTSRISDLGKSIKAAAPIITEKFQLGVEAQFARMLFAVVALFYISWTTLIVVITIAQIKQDLSGLEQALFWGLRLSVISTAVNPFLYGILARQYRLAYYYVVRLWLSKCCYCVAPPLKDVFAAARNLGGDTREGTRRGSQSRYGTQRSAGSSTAGSRFSKSRNVLLTNTNQLALGGLNIALPPRLSRIHEEMSLEPNDSSIAAEFSTHVATAGELSSSVIIPFQARDHNESSTVELEVRGAASMHNLLEAGMLELGNTRDPQSGVENPLALLTAVVGGQEVAVSPSLDYEDAHPEFRATPQFANPVYELSNGTSLQTRAQIEADLANRQNMLAASSTDDITLISKKKKVTKTRSSDAPYRYSDPTLPPGSPAQRNRGLKLPLKQVSRGDHQSYKPLQQEKERSAKNAARYPLDRSSRRDSGGVVRATDIDTGRSVQVASRDLDYQPQPLSVQSRDTNKASSCSPSRVVNPVPPRLGMIEAHTHSRSFDLADLEPGSRARVKHRNTVNSELNEKQGVGKLRGVFESPPPPGQQAPSTSTQTGNHHRQSRSQTGTGRRNSTENSDSGRESMVLDSDPMQAV